jgi:biopolymer transport protein ExbD
MRIRHAQDGDLKAELSMTPMIDIVFLLLVFFVMTFQISAQEGDFNVLMPLAQDGGGPPPDFTQLPIKLRLRADESGQLADMVVNEQRSFGQDWGGLRAYILELTGDRQVPGTDEGPEVEIDLDYQLRYEHVIQAITAVTGYRRGEQVETLVERIKFSPPRR